MITNPTSTFLKGRLDMMRQVLLVPLFLASLSVGPAWAQTTPTATLAERLGYPRDAKLLIVHADDVGMSHSINSATLQALDSGAINSASIMIPCPWLPEVAAYARSHPNADLGLHLTLNSEWTAYRWGPVTSKDRVPSLLDRDGYFYSTTQEAIAHIKPAEAEVELRAQIERARAFGIQPTHLDSHMGLLFQTRDLLAVLLRVARDYKLPVLLSNDFAIMGGDTALFRGLVKPTDILIDHIVTIMPDVPPERWNQFYEEKIRQLQPGVTEMIIHLGRNEPELQGAMSGFEGWGAGWRGRDFDYFMSDAFRRVLRENNVQLVTWREIGKLR
ncbi:MAG TPA: polysaccharide deacetylase family protein [Gemmatimonadales bacterium]|nr:polysaccharide deacetylase family protein [Gemmatimonadales bacterium]